MGESQIDGREERGEQRESWGGKGLCSSVGRDEIILMQWYVLYESTSWGTRRTVTDAREPPYQTHARPRWCRFFGPWSFAYLVDDDRRVHYSWRAEAERYVRKIRKLPLRAEMHESRKGHPAQSTGLW